MTYRLRHLLSLALFIASTMMMATACKTATTVQNTDKHAKTQSASSTYINKVLANTLGETILTAKMKVSLSMDGKQVPLSGNLRMKRGDVVQLSMSVPLLGEVCRMEFTPNDVLIVDRINSRYVRAPYEKIDFLKAANLDFTALEAIFWNNVFYPGSAETKAKIEEYTVAAAGSHTLLSLTTAPLLDYAFLTITENGLLDRTTISPKNTQDKSNLVCVYGDFAKFGASKFPTHIQLSFASDKQTYSLDMSLNSLSSASNWKTRTELSSKYKAISPEQLFKSLFP